MLYYNQRLQSQHAMQWVLIFADAISLLPEDMSMSRTWSCGHAEPQGKDLKNIQDQYPKMAQRAQH